MKRQLVTVETMNAKETGNLASHTPVVGATFRARCHHPRSVEHWWDGTVVSVEDVESYTDKEIVDALARWIAERSETHLPGDGRIRLFEIEAMLDRIEK